MGTKCKFYERVAYGYCQKKSIQKTKNKRKKEAK